MMSKTRGNSIEGYVKEVRKMKANTAGTKWWFIQQRMRFQRHNEEKMTGSTRNER